MTALQNDPGVPTRGVIALCDFGGTGTSITLVDAGAGYAPLGATVRDVDLSGGLVDQALLTHVMNDLSAAGTIDLAGTSAIGSLTQLRAQCRAAKERLSTSGVTSLVAEVPGHRSEVRLTRTELDDVMRQPLSDFTGVLQDTLERNGVRELVAVASVGGGARIPIITTTLSERFRVPVITSGQPELTAAIGGGLAAVRGTAAAAAAATHGTRGGGAARRDDAIGHGRRARMVGRRRCSGGGADRSVRLLLAGRPGRSGRCATSDAVPASSRRSTNAPRHRCRGTADPRW